MARKSTGKDAVDRAYLEKYRTPSAIKFARDLGREGSRATTTELVLGPSRRLSGS
jgi:hypothetical protein